MMKIEEYNIFFYVASSSSFVIHLVFFMFFEHDIEICCFCSVILFCVCVLDVHAEQLWATCSQFLHGHVI